MASKTNMTTPDDDHIQFGNNDSYNDTGLPPGYTVSADDYEIQPQYFGRVMVNNGDGAEIDPEDLYVDED